MTAMPRSKTPSKYLTISVDDGHPTDLKVAELLAKYNLKATFYVPAKNPERPVMSTQDVKYLSSRFELGGHTFNHKPLHKVSNEVAREEILSGKKWLEDISGRAIKSFCYPQGKYNRHTPLLVQEAGFLCGRTCHFNCNDIPQNPFLWGVSTHAYPHSPLVQIRHALLEKNFRGLVDYGRIHHFSGNWETHFHYALQWVSLQGGIAHLFLHSWEIDQNNDWDKLTRILEKAASYKDLTPMTNGDIWQAVSLTSFTK